MPDILVKLGLWLATLLVAWLIVFISYLLYEKFVREK
jgi:hypothetical protein